MICLRATHNTQLPGAKYLFRTVGPDGFCGSGSVYDIESVLRCTECVERGSRWIESTALGSCVSCKQEYILHKSK